jgi:TusA-related sulfurtransferase
MHTLNEKLDGKILESQVTMNLLPKNCRNFAKRFGGKYKFKIVKEGKEYKILYKKIET